MSLVSVSVPKPQSHVRRTSPELPFLVDSSDEVGSSLSIMSTTTSDSSSSVHRNMTYLRLALEMGLFFVDPIPPLAFLESFMPPRSADSPLFVSGMFNDLIPFLEECETS
jgi:hypothetical protein